MSGFAKGFGILFAGALMYAPGQWLNYPTPTTPRGIDGRPNLSAKAPRTSSGTPDLSGVWQTELQLPVENERLFGPSLNDFVVPGDDPRTFSKYFLNILADSRAMPPCAPSQSSCCGRTWSGGALTIPRRDACLKVSRAPTSSATHPSKSSKLRESSRCCMK